MLPSEECNIGNTVLLTYTVCGISQVTTSNEFQSVLMLLLLLLLLPVVTGCYKLLQTGKLQYIDISISFLQTKPPEHS